MKTLTASLVALSLFAGAAHARSIQDFFTDLNRTAPNSAFDTLQDSAPRSPFDQINDTAPRTVFDDIRDSAPRSDSLQDNAP